MRDTSSTLAQEVDLARAYLGILRMNVGKRLDFVIEVSSHAALARLPAMLFLPLIDDVVMRALHSGLGEATLRIAAAVTNDRLNIRVINDTLGAVGEIADAGTIAALRERLTALYHEDGTLRVSMTSGGGMEAVLDIPYERAACPSLADPNSI
jgi:LytS/YehU family sensor histidine kinase